MKKLLAGIGGCFRSFGRRLKTAPSTVAGVFARATGRFKSRRLEQPQVVPAPVGGEEDSGTDQSAPIVPAERTHQGRERIAASIGKVGVAAGGAWRATRGLFAKLAGGARRFGTPRLVGLALGCVAGIAFLLAMVNTVYGSAAKPRLFPGSTYRFELAGSARTDLAPFVDEYLRSNPEFKVAFTSEEPDVVLDTKKRDGFDAILVGEVPELKLKAGTRSVTLRQRKSYWLNVRKGDLIFRSTDPRVAGLASHLSERFESRPMVTLNVMGDILPGRHVTEKMTTYGVDYPFRAMAPIVRGADVAFGDLECPLTDRFPPPTDGMLFSAPKKTIEGIKTLGLNVVSVANNHTTNFGEGPFTDTLKLLTANAIKYCGGGYNYKEAHDAAVVETDGGKYGFLAYNTIKDTIDAGENTPGLAWVSMPPFYPENPQHLKQVATDIAEARKKADFVVVYFHWSKEDEYEPSSSMKKVAHMACDAGADMVIGGHPHSIQPIEIYQGKLIAYSLGNFVFDQMQRDQTREGFVLRCQVTGDMVTRLEMVPYMIFDYCQPVPQTGEKGQAILDHVLDLSGL